ncbi:MAG: PH domain-containing protein [Candidatus Woesearchaeota archaeon]
MPKHHFTLKPSLINAAGPKFFRYLVAYSLASTTIYYALTLTNLIPSTPQLIIALALTTILVSIIVVKRRVIKLHYTQYEFYDTHVVEKSGIVRKKRHSMPYKQISKVQNESSLWDRLTNASNILLKSARHDSEHDLLLRSIKNADEVEHNIYKLLKADAKEENTK